MPTLTAAPSPASGLADDETLRHVRPEVRRLLESVPAFAQLDEEEKRQIASRMVKVAAYMANPDGLVTRAPLPTAAAGGAPLATAQADGVEEARKRASEDRGLVSDDFKATAVREGVKQFGELVKKVDFPMFVSGLIQGVFKAIVDSSIEQMKAYGELLANVAKTVDQFAADNITENNGRDYLAGRFGDQLGIDTSAASGFAEGAEEPKAAPRLTVTAEDPQAALKAISAELGMEKPVTDISDPNEETRLVLAARLQMARSRQQLLASMVILGINRIVITDGLIHAKVVFDMKASDQAKRVARASLYDEQKSHAEAEMKASYGGWFSPISASMRAATSQDHVTTVESSVDDTSESKADVKAKLTGEVRVNFKSDYFPMDKMASPQMIAAIQGNAQPVEKGEKLEAAKGA